MQLSLPFEAESSDEDKNGESHESEESGVQQPWGQF